MKRIVLLWFFWVLSAESGELTISVEPTYPAEQLELIFKPLSQLLKAETGHTLKLVPSMNYYFYWKDAVTDRPDLTFDAPHVASYRITKNGYKPLVKTVEPTIFHLIVDQGSAKDIKHKDDLITKRIATLQHPSMASILYEKWYGHSIVVPNKIIANYAWSDGIDLIFDGEADATIVPEWLLSLYPNFKSIKQSEAMLGMSILASPGLSDELTNKLKKVFLHMRYNNNAYESLVELNTNYFIDADSQEYQGLMDQIPESYIKSANSYLAGQH